MFGLVALGQDKFSARVSTGGEKRTPEGRFFFLAILGGSLGVYAGMMLFRHKTKKMYFILGIPLLMVQQFLILYFFYVHFLSI